MLTVFFMFNNLLKFFFLPLLIPVAAVYKSELSRPTIVLYSWYRNRREYDEIMVSCESADTRKTFAEWQEDANNILSDFDRAGTPYAKIIVRPKPLKHWLRSNNLNNNPQSREQYINFVFNDACKVGIESHLHRK